MRRGGRPIPSATLSKSATVTATAVDFRRPSRVGRDAALALESVHEPFVRRLSNVWSSASHSPVEFEHVATDQLSIEDFVRSLPVPTALGTINVPALGASVFVQVDLPFALLYVERLLGGPGDPKAAPVVRRPTDLETALLAREVIGPATSALDECLRELGGDPSEITGFETAPQPLQLGSPGELLILLTYRAEVRGESPMHGLVTLAYPVAALMAQLDRLTMGGRTAESGVDARAYAAMGEALADAHLDVQVLLGESTLHAYQLAQLAVGDVIRLDHPVERPARLVCDDRVVGSAHVGRRRRRLAVQVAVPPNVATLPPSTPTSSSPFTPATPPIPPATPEALR